MFSCDNSSLCYLDLDVLRLDASASAATAVGARDAHTLLEVLVGMIDRHELVRLVALLEVALARYLVVVRVDELAQLHICSHNSNKRQYNINHCGHICLFALWSDWSDWSQT